MEWQPIETCPRDGSWLLVWNSVHARNGRAPVNVVRWTGYAGYPWVGNDEITSYGDMSFQHWMPLPSPPDLDRKD